MIIPFAYCALPWVAAEVDGFVFLRSFFSCVEILPLDANEDVLILQISFNQQWYFVAQE